jgi:hypothetical protein
MIHITACQMTYFFVSSPPTAFPSTVGEKSNDYEVYVTFLSPFFIIFSELRLIYGKNSCCGKLNFNWRPNMMHAFTELDLFTTERCTRELKLSFSWGFFMFQDKQN